jgi:hypothetical protein
MEGVPHYNASTEAKKKLGQQAIRTDKLLRPVQYAFSTSSGRHMMDVVGKGYTRRALSSDISSCNTTTWCSLYTLDTLASRRNRQMGSKGLESPPMGLSPLIATSASLPAFEDFGETRIQHNILELSKIVTFVTVQMGVTSSDKCHHSTERHVPITV